MIVEDNVGLSQMQKDWFAQAGYDAVTAISEPIARSLIRKTAFDMILSDVRLPEGDGISLLEWLRREKKTFHLSLRLNMYRFRMWYVLLNWVQ